MEPTQEQRPNLKPDEMSSEERLDRIIELLAVASVRLALKDQAANSPRPDKEKESLDSSAK